MNDRKPLILVFLLSFKKFQLNRANIVIKSIYATHSLQAAQLLNHAIYLYGRIASD